MSPHPRRANDALKRELENGVLNHTAELKADQTDALDAFEFWSDIVEP